VHVAVEQVMPEVASAGVAVAAPSDSEVQSSNAAELRVVYLATAADTSCVSHDDDSHRRAVSAGDVSQHMIMDIDGSDSDNDDSTEMTQQSGTGTMLQRN